MRNEIISVRQEWLMIKEGPMSILTTVVFSLFLLTVTGCVTASSPPEAKQETGKKGSTVKPAKHDEKKAMNEESINVIR
jgi:hypothetical protein